MKKFALLSLFLALNALAAPPVFTTLESRRPEIRFPGYTAAEKERVASQASLLLRELFVHREQKMSFYGEQVNPIPALERILPVATQLSEADLHKRLGEIFLSQRDLHTNYFYPKPFSCFRALLPFSLVKARDTTGQPAIAIKSIVSDPEILKLTPGWERLRKGDVLLSFDGLPAFEAAESVALFGAGANGDGRLRRAIENLTFRSQRSGALPAGDTARLRFRDRAGREYAVELNWVSRADLACLGVPPKEGVLGKTALGQEGADEYQIEYEKLYHPRRRGLSVLDGENSWKVSAEPSVSYGKIDNELGSFGYLRLDSFAPVKLSLEDTLAEIERILSAELSGTDGLIIDLRDNGGGQIGYGQDLVQHFAPVDVAPLAFRLLSSETNRFFLRTSPGWDPQLLVALERAEKLGASLTESFTLQPASTANRLGQFYFKPVAILTNASCYSTCDMFTALMQDHAAARVFGEDWHTGAGGANVVRHSEFLGSLPEGKTGPFLALPGGQDMRAAWRQALRVGLNAGQILEDTGAVADELAELSVADLFSSNQFQFRKITRWLAGQSGRFSSFAAISTARQDFTAGQALAFELTVQNTAAVEVRRDGASLSIQPVHAGAVPTVVGIDAGIVPQAGEVGALDFIGYLQGSRVWRRVGSYRIVPESLLLETGLAVEFDDGGVGPLVVFNTDTAGEQGWTVQNGRLKAGRGDGYVDNMKTEASLFLDLSKRTAAALSFEAELNSEKDFDFFSVRVVDGANEELLIEPVSGEVARTPFRFDLSKYAGKRIEIRFLFTSDGGVTARGAWLDHLIVE